MFPGSQRNRIVRFEELAHRTWPCIEETRLGDWILRSAGGFTRRANSALAIGSPGPDLDQAIDTLAAWYRARSVEPCAKITPLADPGLDKALEKRGWTIATPALVLSARVGPSNPGTTPRLWFRQAQPEPSAYGLGSSTGMRSRSTSASDDEASAMDRDVGGSIRLDSSPSPDWLGYFFAWDGTGPSKRPLHEAMFARMPKPRFASWREDGRMSALAVAAQEDGIVHLYDLIVVPEARGRGIGTRFLQALLAHLESEGTREVVLQVLESNTTARALYDTTGFVASHAYHYRVAPPSPCTESSCDC